MDDLVAQFLAKVRAAWRWRWVGAGVAWAVAVIGAVVLLRIPDRYEASARVFVDTKSILKPLMSDLAVDLEPDRTVGMLAQTLITRPNIERLMSSPDLAFLRERDLERTIERLQRQIRVSAVGRENVFEFAYRDIERERARLVVQRLVSLFAEADSGDKRRDAEAARAFIEEQIKSYEERLAEAENRLKEFKLRNLGLVEGAGKDHFARIAALSEDLAKQQGELRAAEESRDALKRQLAGEEPILASDVPTGAAASLAPEIDARLETQRKQLDDLQRRYTDLHPDVVAAKRLITQLEAQRNEEVDKQRRAADGKPQRASNNPVFQKIKLGLAEAEANVAALRARVRDMQGRIAQMRSSAGRVHQVEAELAQLNRDYDVVRRSYEALVVRREKASISEGVDASTQLAHFRVIEPPRASAKPVFPNRLLLAPLVLIAALAAGVTASLMMSRVVPTVDNTRQLRSVTQRQVLGSISLRLGEAPARSARRGNVGFGAALGSLVLAYGAWMAWIAMTAGPWAPT